MRSSTSGAAARPALASSYAALAHLPGPPRSAFPLGYMYRALRDPLGVSQRSYDAFGPVFRRGNFGGWGVSLIGPEAIEIVLLNRGLTFSSEKGWESILGRNLSPWPSGSRRSRPPVTQASVGHSVQA